MLAFEIKFKKASGVRYTAYQLADVAEMKNKTRNRGREDKAKRKTDIERQRKNW